MTGSRRLTGPRFNEDDLSLMRERAEEILRWLADNNEGQFNIRCQRCNAPFEHEGQAVAAPPEWYGGLAWEKQLAEDLLELLRDTQL